MAVHEYATGAAISASLAGVAAAVGLAFALVVWRRGLIGFREFAVILGLTLAGIAALALLFSTSRPERQAAVASPPAQVGLAERADALLARAIAPNSPLACVDAAAGEQVAEACEAVLFARPETIAAAVSYVTAKVVLLAQAVSRKQVDATGEAPALALLQHDLAADRYGIVAHVLEATYGCSADHCDAFAVVRDPAQIKANLRDSRFDRLVAKHAPAWPPAGEHPPGAAEVGVTGTSAEKPKIDFPSASDIPPVSIMVPEESRHRSGAGHARKTAKPAAKPRLPADRPSRAPAATAPAAVPASRANNSAGASRDQ